MNFLELETTVKGTIGEAIAAKYLKKRGYHVYTSYFDGSHPFDFYLHANGRDYLADVKTYPRLYLAAQTGIDLSDWEKYKGASAQTGLPFLVLFVDVFEAAIYGNRLEDLKPCRKDASKVYFSLSSCILIAKLSDSDLKQLKPIKRPERYNLTVRYFK